MKEHSNNFETEIKTYGRQQAVQVIFEQDGQQVVLDNENVFSVTPNYKASLLKSAMKSLILDCNVEIPVGTRLQFKYGILVNNAYEYLNFGYYIVNKIEKKEDARSYEITCYDKMMLTMVDYIDLEISYPITIRNYIAEICNFLEIDFGSYQDQFVNYDKQIPSELYLDENGNSLEYTFRDVLDELSQVTASIICIDENDQLVVKYPQRNGDYETIEGTSLYIENADDNKIDLELQGNTSQNGTPTPDAPVNIDVVTGENTIKIVGKNVLKINDATNIGNYLNYNIQDGVIRITGTANNTYSTCTLTNLINIAELNKIPNGTKLTFSVLDIEGLSASQIFIGKSGNNYWMQPNKTTKKVTVTKNADITYMSIWFPTTQGQVYDITIKPMLVIGETAYDYEPFQGKDYEINLGNIELNKIGNYQDFIKKGTGKNLYDKNNVTRTGASNQNIKFTTTLLPNTQYTFNITSNRTWGTIYLYDSSNTQTRTIGNYSDVNKLTFTTSASEIKGDFIFKADTNVDISTYDFTGVQLEKGSTATFYEPYGYKDKWYIEKNVGKVVLDSNCDVARFQASDVYRFAVGVTGIDSIGVDEAGVDSQLYCNLLKPTNRDKTYAKIESMCYGMATNTSYKNFIIYTDETKNYDVATFKTWLGTNKPIVYYIRKSTIYTLINNEDLIEQLERVHLEQGLNNVSIVTYNEQPVLKMSYVSNLIEIDEEQLKDINVNFGEKYGPINSVVIARAADSDFIYKEDDQSVAENGLCEVKISDNQILNDDNRTQFLDGIYYQLKGTEFYLNDFSSTGIVYLDLLDYYKVKVFDNYYKCLMLNDEINITQGLQEQVFTERPKESETEYKSIAKQDKDIRKIGIIVNKVEGEITAEIIARQDTDEKVSNLTQTIGEISTTVSTTTTQVEDLETRVYTNETSISQNADSITATISRIQQTEDDVETLQTNTEDVVNQLVFGDDGLTISAKGTTTDDMKLNLTNDAIKFLYQNNAILTINGSVIEFSNASFKKLDLGNYVWQAEDDDSLSLIYEGD